MLSTDWVAPFGEASAAAGIDDDQLRTTVASGHVSFGGRKGIDHQLRPEGLSVADAWATACAALDCLLLSAASPQEEMRQQLEDTYRSLRVRRDDPLETAGRARLFIAPDSSISFTVARRASGELEVRFADWPKHISDYTVLHRLFYSVASQALQDVEGGAGLLQQVLWRRLQ